MGKQDSIVELMERRILRGDYSLKDLPAEERLAEELGTSRMTTRRAMIRLVEKGLLERQANGRVIARRQGEAGVSRGQVALLVSAYTTLYANSWQASLTKLATKMRVGIRKVDFVHWDDPVVLEVFDRFDGVFLIPHSEEIPLHIADRLAKTTTPLVVLDTDLSPLGIRSIDLTPAAGVRAIMEHLTSLGHTQIACLNTQPITRVIQDRIDTWGEYLEARGFRGRLINEPVEAYNNSMAHAHQVISKFLQARQPDFTAIVTTAMSVAMGAMRGFRENRITIGKDLALAAINDEGLSAYLNPTVTSTLMPDPEPFLSLAIEWILGDSDGWPESRVLRPATTPLFVGESSAPVPKS